MDFFAWVGAWVVAFLTWLVYEAPWIAVALLFFAALCRVADPTFNGWSPL